MDVRRKHEGGKDVSLCGGGKRRPRRKAKNENKAERPSRRRETEDKRLEEEAEGSVATLDVQCPPLSAELLRMSSLCRHVKRSREEMCTQDVNSSYR